VNIVFQSHHADVPEALQRRAEQAVTKLGVRLRGAVDASVRFAEDGPLRRVELTLRAARREPLVATGEARAYEAALTAAVDRMEAQVAHLKELRERAAKRARTVDGAPADLALLGPETDDGDAEALEA
jgi:ribosome-associated translation inhibitor RaiA